MSKILGPAPLLPISLGLADGILNALTLASASLVGGGAPITVELALRISVAAVVTAAFSVFVGTYSEARGRLRHASQQLSLSAERSLAATRLGRQAVMQAVTQCLLAGAASLLGALLPLLIGAALPGPTWVAAVVAICALGVLGVGLATAVVGSRVTWAIALVIGGVGVTAIGAWINIA
jgi:VIT1/CCC1 family predicted Fe2+/Mn2+ transporter